MDPNLIWIMSSFSHALFYGPFPPSHLVGRDGPSNNIETTILLEIEKEGFEIEHSPIPPTSDQIWIWEQEKSVGWRTAYGGGAVAEAPPRWRWQCRHRGVAVAVAVAECRVTSNSQKIPYQPHK